MARHASPRKRRRPSGQVHSRLALAVVALLAAGGRLRRVGDLCHVDAGPPPHDRDAPRRRHDLHRLDDHHLDHDRPPGPGFNAGQVTAVGDSVMLDYQDPLKTAIPGINVDAAVSRQWSDGEAILQTLKADGQLGGDVIVGLGTNGPITDSEFDNMMTILGGASRVVFVNVHVDRPWQDPNNAVLASGATRYPNAVVADWATLAAQNPALVRRGRHPPRHRRPGRRRARTIGGHDAVQRVNRRSRPGGDAGRVV